MSTSPRPDNWNRWRLARPLFAATFLGVTAIVLVGVFALYTLTNVDPVTWWTRINLAWLGCSVGLFVLGNLLIGHRFLALMPLKAEVRPSPWGVGSVFFAGHVFTLAVPGPVGEIAAVAAMRARWGLDMRDGLATMIYTRLVGLAASGMVAVMALPWISLDDRMGRVLMVAGVLVGAATLVLVTLTRRPALLHALGAWMTGKTTEGQTGALAWLLRRGGRQIALFADSLHHVGVSPWKMWLKVLGWSLVIQLVHLGALLCTCQALALAPTLPALLLARGMGSLTIVASMFLPGGLGTYEVVFVGCMVGAGGLSVLEAGLLVLSVRIVHLLGIACSGLAFAAWAKVLLSQEVAETLQAEGVSLPSNLHD